MDTLLDNLVLDKHWVRNKSEDYYAGYRSGVSKQSPIAAIKFGFGEFSNLQEFLHGHYHGWLIAYSRDGE